MEGTEVREEKKKLDLNATVKPVIAWSALGGTLAIAVIVALICWLYNARLRWSGNEKLEIPVTVPEIPLRHDFS